MPRRIILVILALLISGGAVFLTQMLLRAPRGHNGKGDQSVASRAPPAEVLVAKSDLYAGEFVKPADLTWQAWPSASVPADYAVETRSRLQDYVGAVVTARMSPGDPVTPAHLVRPGERGFMAAVLAPGDRAVTVNVTPSTGMGGFLYPGDRVDILLTQTVQSSAVGGVARHVSETILHGVKVVGLDQTLSDKKDDAKGLGVPKTATLEVTPKQAEIVAVAADMGVLTLALDSVAEPREAEPQTITKTWDTEATQLAFGGPPAASRARQPDRATEAPVWTVDVVRGGATVRTPFPAAAAGTLAFGS